MVVERDKVTAHLHRDVGLEPLDLTNRFGFTRTGTRSGTSTSPAARQTDRQTDERPGGCG